MFTGTLAGPPVAMAAKGNLLAVVWHSAPPALPENQSLMFAVYDANHRLLLHEGALPITNGSTLTWLGFSDEGLLSTFDTQVRRLQALALLSRRDGGAKQRDISAATLFSSSPMFATSDRASQGVLRVRTVDFGGSWVPLFAAAAHQKGEETYWPVAVTKAELFCIVCASAAVPSILPRPVLTK